MLTHSSRHRSRSPHSTNGTSSIKSVHHSDQDDLSSHNESTNNNKSKKESESQQRLRNLKSFIQTLINESTLTDSTSDEQVKALESACVEEYHDISLDRIRRMIRSALKLRKSHQSSATTPFLHRDRPNTLSTTTDRFNSNENHTKKNRSNSISNNSATKTSDLITSSPSSTLSALDADFLRHAFSQQFRPTLDLSGYFSTATGPNSPNPGSPLFRPNFSPSNFLQSLTNTTPLVSPSLPSLSSTLVSSHTHTNGTNEPSIIKSSKQMKLSSTETNSIKVLVNAYREAASYLSRSADELEQLI